MKLASNAGNKLRRFHRTLQYYMFFCSARNFHTSYEPPKKHFVVKYVPVISCSTDWFIMNFVLPGNFTLRKTPKVHWSICLHPRSANKSWESTSSGFQRIMWHVTPDYDYVFKYYNRHSACFWKMAFTEFTSIYFYLVISKTKVHTSNIYHHVLGSYWLGVQAPDVTPLRPVKQTEDWGCVRFVGDDQVWTLYPCLKVNRFPWTPITRSM